MASALPVWTIRCAEYHPCIQVDVNTARAADDKRDESRSGVHNRAGRHGIGEVSTDEVTAVHEIDDDVDEGSSPQPQDRRGSLFGFCFSSEFVAYCAPELDSGFRRPTGNARHRRGSLTLLIVNAVLPGWKGVVRAVIPSLRGADAASAAGKSVGTRGHPISRYGRRSRGAHPR